MRQLKNRYELADLDFDKHTRKIKLYCHIFYEYVNSKLRATIPEYQQGKIHDRKEGILFCPDCIVEKIKERNGY